MAYGTPGAFSVIVPNHEASGKLIVGFSRNVKDYAVNRYTQIRPVKERTGLYMRWKSEQEIRRPYDDGRDRVWADGSDRPHGVDNTEMFEWTGFKTLRRSYNVLLGDMTVEGADWPIEEAHKLILQNQYMLDRTLLALSALAGADWAGESHTSTANAILGSTDNSDDGTPTNPCLKKLFNHMALAIFKKTNGAVKQKDLVIVTDPETCEIWGRTQEVHAYLKESQFALAQVRGDAPSQNGQWGMPDQLYGYKIEVEDAVRISNRRNSSSTTRAFALASGTFYMISRPGKLVNNAMPNTPAFSTVTTFMKEEMSVEQTDDRWNRRRISSITTDYETQVVSPKSGFQITSAFG